jgi:hypothetical protein
MKFMWKNLREISGPHGGMKMAVFWDVPPFSVVEDYRSN